MLNKNLKKTPKLIIALIVFSLSILYFPTQSMLMADPAIQENVPSSEGSKPIIVYYSRTGKTRIVANALKEQLTCEIAEIKSTEDREGFWGVITCVLDSLLDRDDIIEPFNKDLKGYNPIIIASPIWIGKLSSPARTFIKQAELKDKEVDIFLTYNGKLTEEKEKALEDKITSQGIELKCLYKIITKEKTEEEVQKEVITQLNERPILKKKADN
ncbi:MAG: hypothetical protein KAS98_06200 [Deltaproteobacteria bacterium]|nr:hypothetical protein [Deltaproteobacteria bacterium]